MTSVEEVLGKPFITKTGKRIPDYALPIIKAYYEKLPLEDPKSYHSPVTPDVAEQTIIAVEQTLKRLSGNPHCRDLSYLPVEEYNQLSQSILPSLPSQFSIKGSAKHLAESEKFIEFAESIWKIVKEALDLPHSASPNKTSEIEHIVDKNYKTSSSAKGVYLWLAQLGTSLTTLAGTIPLGFALDSPAPAIISGVLSGITFLPGPALWVPYGDMICNRRVNAYYEDYKANRQLEVKQELESFILQAQTVGSLEVTQTRKNVPHK